MKKKSDWLIPLGLIFLTLIPTIAGIVRLVGLSNGSPVNPENARFHSSSVAIFIHIISSLIFGIFGAFQFSAGLRKTNPKWHRLMGRFLIPMGTISALTGLYLTQIFPKLETDGPTLYYVRLVVGVGMTVCIALAIKAILARKYTIHGAWMTRAYAIGLGAGMQVVTHLPWFIFTSGAPTGLERDGAMAAGWLINIVFVEWRLSKIS